VGILSLEQSAIILNLKEVLEVYVFSDKSPVLFGEMDY
jgi:hypothetical protein